MTRFWITLQQGVDFVIANLERMHGGEIFVPRIPSVRIIDVAKALAPSLPTRIVGVRPGEKLHEIMCPGDDSHLTLEFADHFVICPGIKFHRAEINYAVNGSGERGALVARGFEYNSETNPYFLSVEEIGQYNRLAGM
jgi:UDP-N-acetylglucosamine 4,6-dehydratase